MEEQDKEDIYDESETKEETVKKPIIQSIFQKPKAPIFGNANKFGKPNKGNDFNSRQRPGRAAGRGR